MDFIIAFGLKSTPWGFDSKKVDFLKKFNF